MKRDNSKDRTPTLTKALIVLLVTILIFVVTVFVFEWYGKPVSDTLIATFLGMCATELATMGGIQIFKIKGGQAG